MQKLFAAALAGCMVLPLGCSTGVEPSPGPGLVRVTLKGVETDTMIVIQNDSSQFSRWDTFGLFVATGRVYKGENYAPIYTNPSSDRKTSDTVNILAREWLDGRAVTIQDTARITARNSRYRQYKIFESYVPPGTYDRLSFALTAWEMEIWIPKHYLNPVQLPPGVPPVIEVSRSFTVREGGVTEIAIEVYPYRSLQRFRDTFYFNRQIVVAGVTEQ